MGFPGLITFMKTPYFCRSHKKKKTVLYVTNLIRGPPCRTWICVLFFTGFDPMIDSSPFFTTFWVQNICLELFSRHCGPWPCKSQVKSDWFLIPISSMVSIWLIFVVNVGQYARRSPMGPRNLLLKKESDLDIVISQVLNVWPADSLTKLWYFRE